MSLTKFRNKLIGSIYRRIVKPILFKCDPEKVHDNHILAGKILGSNFITRTVVASLFYYNNPLLHQEIDKIKYENPLGLAAGFDKDAVLTKILPSVGFGFEEVGSITGEPCKGNTKPRLWRIPSKKSLRVYYGLKNEGSQIISRRLNKISFKIPIGTSIAKTNCEATANTKTGIKDYVKAYKAFANIGSYTTINISCPNAFGGQPFTDKKRLNLLLKEICNHRNKKPLYLKLSPDLTKKQLDDILSLVKKYQLQGVILSNLTKTDLKKKGLKGGLSGKPVSKKSLKQISYVYKKTKGNITIIACGGVFNAKDAYERIKAGASLIQLITGMIFQGPQLISDINEGLVELLKKDGFENIGDAIGRSSK